MSSSQGPLKIIATASHFPEKILGNEEFPGITEGNHRMFQGCKFRHHISNEQTAVDLFAKAIHKMDSEQPLPPIDGILTNVSLPDMPFTGCGAILAQAIHLKNPKFILDAHNGGCISFIFLLDLAHSLMRSYSLNNILICVGQTAAGRGFSGPEVKKKPQAAIPGDGVSVALVSSSPEAKGLSVGPIFFKCHPEYSSDMIIIRDDGTSYWQNSLRPMYIDFNEDKLSSIIMRGNRLVPAAMKEVLKMAEIKASEVDALITNQPNPYFLRNWRESIQLPEEKHFQSFERYANLFQAGIPVNLDEALRSGKLKEKAKILLAGFSHAGDYSGAALLGS